MGKYVPLCSLRKQGPLENEKAENHLLTLLTAAYRQIDMNE